MSGIRPAGAIAELQRFGLSYCEAQAWLTEHAAAVEKATTPKRDRVLAVRAVAKKQGLERR